MQNKPICNKKFENFGKIFPLLLGRGNKERVSLADTLFLCN